MKLASRLLNDFDIKLVGPEAEIERFLVYFQAVEDALHDIATARGDLCEQTPYWAEKALATHPRAEPEKRSKT